MDRDQLLARRLPEAKVDIPDLGPVVVRGLSRGEVFALRAQAGDELALQVATIATCMVDPTLSEDDVRAWFANAVPGEIEPVFQKMRELSGLIEGAQKSNGKSADDG